MTPIPKCNAERGQSLVEFAVIAVVLFTLIFGIFEFGRAFYAYSATMNAASEGARYAIIDQTSSCIQKVATSSMFALNVPTNNVSVITPAGGAAFGKPITVTVNYTFTAVTPYIPDLLFVGRSTMTVVNVPSVTPTCPVTP